jgi:hypothetical protein
MTTKLPTIHPPPNLVGLVSSSEYGCFFMPTTSLNMGHLQCIPSMPCEGGHLVLTLHASLHLATFIGPSLGVSNGEKH